MREVNNEFKRLINLVLDTAKSARQTLYQNQDNLAMRLRNGGTEKEAAEVVRRLDSWQCTDQWGGLDISSNYDLRPAVERGQGAGPPSLNKSSN